MISDDVDDLVGYAPYSIVTAQMFTCLKSNETILASLWHVCWFIRRLLYENELEEGVKVSRKGK